MDQSTKPPTKAYYTFNKRVNQQFGLEPVYRFKSTIQIGEDKETYKCSIHFGKKVVSTDKIYTSKLEAASWTAKLALGELEQLGRNDLSTLARIKKNKIRIAEKGWVHVKNVNNVYEHLSDDIFATQFKNILEQFIMSRDMKEAHYDTQLHTDGEITGYISILDFNEKTYKSIGLMLSGKQAEQSAAEVCLRSIGRLPSRENQNEFTIQPYQGGSSKKIKKLPVTSRVHQQIDPRIFITSAFTDMLRVYLNCHYMQSPKYFIRDIESLFDKSEIDADGNPMQIVECICCFEGKVFKAKYPHVMSIAPEFAAAEALKYFGVSNPVEKLEIRKSASVNRYDFSQCSSLTSPFHHPPSEKKNWRSRRFCRNEKYDDCTTEMLFSSGIIGRYTSGNDVYVRDIVSKELSRNPAFKFESLFTIKDLAIAEVDPNNPNVFLIGNSEFSIKMLCEGGKIFSKKRECDVELLPGHNILQLNSHYKVTLPSLEVYLKGVECDDVTIPNPPLPVVTSCGISVLFHDHESSPNDIYVILRRGSNLFERATDKVQSILLQSIMYLAGKGATPAQWMEDNTYTDMKLLSEMSMGSLKEFISKIYSYYDADWWNGMFSKNNLPVKKLHDLCLKELQRREEEGHEVDEVLWTLPETEFISRFETVGINLEASNTCAFRALVECGGNMRIKLGDIDQCPIVDLPVENEEKKHRGDVMRYYIWKACKKVTGNEKVTYLDQLDTGETPYNTRTLKREGWHMKKHMLMRARIGCDTKYLKDDFPHGFIDERKQYFQGVYYDDVKPNIYGNDEGNKEKGEDNGSQSGEQEKIIDGASTEERENNDGQSGEEDKIIATDEEKEVQDDADQVVNEPIAVDEAVTDEYGTIGETADASKKQEDANEGDQDVDEPMRDEEYTPAEEIKEGEEEVAITEAGEQMEGESENEEGEEEVANTEADEQMEGESDNEEGEEEVANTEADEQVEGESDNEDIADDDVSNSKADKSMENREAKIDYKDVPIRKKNNRHRNRIKITRGSISGTVEKRFPYMQRKALHEQCIWMKLDEAVHVCPMLKKISVTSQFQNQIKLLIVEANNFMESKGMSEKIVTSVLLDDEECTD